MRALAVVSLCLLASAGRADAIGFDRYHTHDEVNAYLDAVAEEWPDVATVVPLGTSQQGRAITYIRLAVPGDARKPAIYLNGTHHGDEKSSTESVLGVLDHFARNKSAPEVAAVLAAYDVYLQPVVNPDGHAAHTREDVRGRDPNRDYSHPGRDDDRSFDLPEIAAVKRLQDEIKPYASLAYHSGMEGILLPWCYRRSNTNDHSEMLALFGPMADALGMPIFRSSVWYTTSGEYIDYAYMSHATRAVTVEVSSDKTPPVSQLTSLVRRTTDGTMTFFATLLNPRQAPNGPWRERLPTRLPPVREE